MSSSCFKMGGAFADFDEGEESDDPLGDSPVIDHNPSWILNDDDDDDFTIRKIPSEEIIFETVARQAKVVGTYLIGNTLGEGSYGKVKEALCVNSLRRLAIKIMKKKKLRRIPHGEENVRLEICMLKRLDHENIIKLSDVLYNRSKEKLYLVMEFCVCSLFEMLNEEAEIVFPEWQAHFYFTQLIDGLEYLHSRGIIHKDIKPSNLLLTTSESLKISDFGVAEQIDLFAQNDLCTTSQGSPAFQSPEIANGLEHFSGSKLDIWACGVSLYNMITSKYPFEGENVYKLFENIGKCHLKIPDSVNSVLKEILEGMLLKDFNRRFSIAQIRSHAWYTNKYYEYELRIPLPEEKKTQNHMTTLPYLQLYNDGEIKLIENDNTKNLSEILGKRNSNSDFFNVHSVSETSVDKNPKERETSKQSKLLKYTPGNCKAM